MLDQSLQCYGREITIKGNNVRLLGFDALNSLTFPQVNILFQKNNINTTFLAPRDSTMLMSATPLIMWPEPSSSRLQTADELATSPSNIPSDRIPILRISSISKLPKISCPTGDTSIVVEHCSAEYADNTRCAASAIFLPTPPSDSVTLPGKVDRPGRT